MAEDTKTNTTTADKPDDQLTIGEYIARHSFSGSDKRDMNNNQIADVLGMSSQEVVEIQRELGHTLPEGAN